MAKKLIAFLAVLMLVYSAPAAASPMTDLIDEVRQLKQDVERGQSELAGLDAELERTTKDIIHLYQSVEAHEALLEQQKSKLNNRFQEVYKSYDDIVLSIFLDASNFTDLWRRFAFLARINQADNELLAANERRAERVVALKEELAVKKAAQIELKHRKQQQYAEMEQTLIAKKALLEAKAARIRAAAIAPELEQAAVAGEAPPALKPQRFQQTSKPSFVKPEF